MSNYPFHLTFFLKNKIGYFSQATNRHEAEIISRKVAPDGSPVRLSEFRKHVKAIVPNYNSEILENEFHLFYAMAQMYAKWKCFEKEKDESLVLIYDAVLDGNTCKVCRQLDGIQKHIDDHFWDTYYPPNCHTCRCSVRVSVPGGKMKDPDISRIELIKPAPIYRINIGKHELILPY